MPFFIDSRDNHQGWIPDLIWQDWVRGKVPSSLGDHEVTLAVPKEWRAKRAGRILDVTGITAKVRVQGLGITILGKTEQYSLLDPSTISIEKATVSASFDAPSGKYPLTTFQTEEELEAFLKRPATVKVVQRLRLPRIKSGPMFWPPSERVHGILIERFRSALASNAAWDDTLADFEGIEGDDLQAVFEPIWQNHPMIRRWRGKGEGVEE